MNCAALELVSMIYARVKSRQWPNITFTNLLFVFSKKANKALQSSTQGCLQIKVLRIPVDVQYISSKKEMQLKPRKRPGVKEEIGSKSTFGQFTKESSQIGYEADQPHTHISFQLCCVAIKIMVILLQFFPVTLWFKAKYLTLETDLHHHEL